MRLIVTGSRDWTDNTTLTAALTHHWETSTGPFTLIHGAASRGADQLADQWATRINSDPDMGPILDVERHPADWRRHGLTAGHRRNAVMVHTGADLVAAFLLPCGKSNCRRREHHPSHGTENLVDLARVAGIPIRGYGDRRLVDAVTAQQTELGGETES